ncbi:MAG TPA: Ig-like domain-containing protein [Pyrinomonadaceae bacterium]|jgi:hypothetical protein
MATDSTKDSFSQIFADTSSPESVRRQFIDEPLRGAQQAAIGSALDLAKVLGALPEALAASQRRELERLQRSAEKDDPRIALLEASIEEVDILRTMARRGETRARRAMVALTGSNEVFHGFVSDSEFNPLPELTVRLTSNQVGAKELSATTEADGYFSITLSRKSRAKGTSARDVADLTPEKIAEMFVRQEQQKDVKGQPESLLRTKGRIEILRKNKVIHEDPVAVELDEVSVYREYVISAEGSSPPPAFQPYAKTKNK